MTSGLKATSDRVFFVPLWIRWSALLLLALLFGCAIYVFLMATQGMMRSEWIAPALSVLQFAGTGALALLVMFFVERGHSAPHLTALADEFLTAEIPKNLHKIEHDLGPFKPWFARRRAYRRFVSRTKLLISHDLGTHTAYYIVEAFGKRVALQVEANVNRFNIVFFCPEPTAQQIGPDGFFAALEDTFEGARDAGYHIGKPMTVSNSSNRLPKGFLWGRCFSIPLHLNKKDGYLYSVSEREHVSQDLSIMVRAFILEGIEQNKL